MGPLGTAQEGASTVLRGCVCGRACSAAAHGKTAVGTRVLTKEKTARVDALLAGVVAGVVVDAVEPLARSQGHQVRAKAIEIVANEFLNRAAGMSSAHPHRKNHNNQMSRINEAAVLLISNRCLAAPMRARSPRIPKNQHH